MDLPIEFSVQAPLTQPAASWRDFARKVEDLGFSALFVADHPANTASPFVALAAAASSTTTLKLGTYVLNMGAREPLHVASDAATLDLVSEGRVILGAGAGHTPTEWTMFGRPYPSPKERVGRAVEAIDATQRLLAGEVVTISGSYVHLDEAKLVSPLPIQDPIPLLVGGNNFELLRFAARRADIVAMSGLGRTLTGGHFHEMRGTPAEVDKRVKAISNAAENANRRPVINLLIHHVEVTADRQETAERLAALIEDLMPEPVQGLTADELLQSPFLLIGSPEQLIEQVMDSRDRWGISSYTVRADAVDLISPVLKRLN